MEINDFPAFDLPGFFCILLQSQYPMQIIKPAVISFFFCCHFLFTQAQLDTTAAKQQALAFADSIVKANFFQDWKTYMDLSIPTAIKYYGGKEGFRDYISNLYFRTA